MIRKEEGPSGLGLKWLGFRGLSLEVWVFRVQGFWFRVEGVWVSSIWGLDSLGVGFIWVYIVRQGFTM